jgi:hypothetical protein
LLVVHCSFVVNIKRSKSKVNANKQKTTQRSRNLQKLRKTTTNNATTHKNEHKQTKTNKKGRKTF